MVVCPSTFVEEGSPLCVAWVREGLVDWTVGAEMAILSVRVSVEELPTVTVVEDLTVVVVTEVMVVAVVAVVAEVAAAVILAVEDPEEEEEEEEDEEDEEEEEEEEEDEVPGAPITADLI